MRNRTEGKKMNKRKVKKIVTIMMLSILVVTLISVGLYYGIKAYSDYKEKKSYNDLSDYMNDADNDELIEEKTAKMVKLEELHNQYPNVVAWLDIPGTAISFPIVQNKESNTYYLTHTYKGENSARGSIYLDMDVDLEKPSENFLIYGHRNKNGAMFEPLMNYEKEAFYKDHKTLTFTTLNDDSEYEIIAAFRSRIYYKSEKNVFRYYYFVNADNTSLYNPAIQGGEPAFNDFVKNAKNDSMYAIEPTASYGDQLITLSTCAYHSENGRFAVVAKKTKKLNVKPKNEVNNEDNNNESNS